MGIDADYREELKKRDIAVLRLLADGLSNREIAEELILSAKTIEHFLGSEPIRGIFPKIRVKNRAAAAAWYSTVSTKYKFIKRNAENELRSVYHARMSGAPSLAIDWAEKFANLLPQEIDRNLRLFGGQRTISRILARFLFEQIIALCEISLHRDVETATRQKIEQIRRVAKECDNDPEILGLANYASGLVHYVQGKFGKSIKFLETARKQAKNNELQLKILRTLTLDLAALQDIKAFTNLRQQATEHIASDKYSLEIACMAWEGLGRGEGLLGIPSALDTLERGWDIYHRMPQKVPVRFVQLSRSELAVAHHFQSREGLWLENRGREGLEQAKRFGYPRYARHIEQLLNLTLN